MLRRLWSLLRKEVRQLGRDPVLLVVIAWLFTVEVLLCAYALTFDLREAPVAVIDLDRTPESRRIVDGLDRSPYFDVAVRPTRPDVAEELLDSERVLLVVQIPDGWTRHMYRGEEADIQLLVDGSNAATAATARGYAQTMLTRDALEAMSRGGVQVPSLGIENRTRVWYNAPLRFLYFNVISMVALAAMLVAVIHPAASIVKEKEAGTVEQLLVSPVSTLELVLAKVLVTLVLSLAGLTASLGLVAWFQVPVRGSLALFYLASVLFLFAAIGIGVLIATVSKSLQQALLLSFFGLIPVMFLSGTMVPIESMPRALQLASLLSPLRFYMDSLLGIFLKGAGFEFLWPRLVAMVVLATAIFGLGLARFRRSLA